MSQESFSIRCLKMVTCFRGLSTAPVFHFAITKSKFGISETDLFFPEPPDRAHSFVTLRWIHSSTKTESTTTTNTWGDMLSSLYKSDITIITTTTTTTTTRRLCKANRGGEARELLTELLATSNQVLGPHHNTTKGTEATLKHVVAEHKIVN